MPPRLGVLDFHPIQYHTPLYQALTLRGIVRLSVLYLHDAGHRPIIDPGFGVPVAWNIDLLSGYDHGFMTSSGLRTSRSGVRRMISWIKSQDTVIIHGHSNPWMLLAAAICRAANVPYLLRGDSGPTGMSTGIRRVVRDAVARAVVSASAGGLAVGQLNQEFYEKYGAPQITFAPHSVDNDRFARAPAIARAELLARWGLDNERPVLMFCGKLRPAKRPLDLAAAVSRLPQQVTTIFVGDGTLANQVRASLPPGAGVVTGFVNQAELPVYYHAADILVLPSQAEPWGLVINEAMAAGTLPVASDRVGAAPDLVEGFGEVYRCGDVGALTDALSRALDRLKDPRTAAQVRRQVARYSIEATAVGFERAAMSVQRSHAASGTRLGDIRPP
jgi:glycosyltransferase involved in cell wall biosynthesis